MAINYTYTKYKDVHFLTNGELVPLNYVVNKISCDSSISLAQGIIGAEEIVSIPFKTDGQYQIVLTKQGDVPETVYVPNIYYYNNLLLSFISVVQNVLCGCSKSRDCQEGTLCEDYLDAYSKAFAYASLNDPTYKLYLDIVTKDAACSFSDAVLCGMLNEKVYGNQDAKDVMIRVLSYYYCAFYYKDKFLASDTSEEEYVSYKYKFDVISKCMRKLGIDPAEAINAFENDTIVYFWQLQNTEDDITQVLPLITLDYLQTKANLPFSNFEQGQIVAYSAVGRIVFAIAPTQVQNFTVTDSLNNDITNDFDVHYDPIYSIATFVSKNVMSYGDIYFKFKKLI